MNQVNNYLFNPVNGKNGKSRIYFQVILFISLMAAGLTTSFAQVFISGSNGTDGEFSPTTSQTVQLPESGVLNYTTVNIPSGVVIKFAPNSRNTPVTILATGNVVISGVILLDGNNGLATGVGGTGGPGGSQGGAGGINVDFFGGKTGDGRGGGTGGGGGTSSISRSGGGGGGFGSAGNNASVLTGNENLIGIGGPVNGSLSLLPMTGGSGGGGGGADVNYNGAAGGGGGGAILIASTGSITVSGHITAVGGNGAGSYCGGTGGGGSGGAIRLIANTLSGTGTLNVAGGYAGTVYGWCSGSWGGNGGRGYLRAEAYDYSNFSPGTNSVPLNITLPNPVFPPSGSQLRISSIGGVSVPAVTKASLHAVPDITLPSTLANPVEVQVEASGIPVGSIGQITVTPSSGARTTYQTTALSGTTANSTATASISLPQGMSVITVTLSVNLQTAKAQPMFINGEKINRIEVAANLGNESETVYITASGKRVKFPY